MGIGRSVHTFRRELFVKFRKSPHRTEKSLRHAQKPANPRSTNPIGPESTSVEPGKDPPMATPPQGRKMAPERPFPILIETGKSYSKTGLLPAVLPVVSRRFTGGFPTVFSASSTPVSRPFGRQVRRRFDSHFPATRFPWINPPVRLRRFPWINPRSDSGPSPSSERNAKKRQET